VEIKVFELPCICAIELWRSML